MDVLLNYDYPGNVRELENIMEHACILSQGEVIEGRHLPGYLQTDVPVQGDALGAPVASLTSRDEWEKQRLLQALKENHWHRQKAAEVLGMDRTTLWRKLKKYRLLP